MNITILLWLTTCEPLEPPKINMPHFKALLCGMNAIGSQSHGGLFTLDYTSLNMAVLLQQHLVQSFGLRLKKKEIIYYVENLCQNQV